jgi:hypothetical protein
MVAIPRSTMARALSTAARPRRFSTPAPSGWMASVANQVGQQQFDLLEANREPEKAWWQKALSPVLEGPIGAGLNVIDTGRRAAVSTVKETIDLLQGEGFSGTDWGNQIASHYGFGDILRDENVDLGKWGNRIVGFIGDVALDPITYLTFGSGALAKQGWRQVADELAGAANGAKTAAERAAFNAARQRVARTGSKMAAGPSALRGIGYEVGLGFSMPGTGMFGRAVGMDKALDMITGGAVSARRAAEWAPAFQAAGARYGMDAAQSTKLFERAVRLGREDARKLFEEEARVLAGKRPGFADEGFAVGAAGDAVPTGEAARSFIEETADELLGVAQRARKSRTELFWRNGQASLEAPNWERYVAVPGMRQTVGVGRQVARGAEELTDTGLGVVIRTVTSAPGRGVQRALQSNVAKNLSSKLSRDDLLRTWLQSDNPVKYWAGRMVETGESIGFANAGKYSNMVDSLQAQMLDMAHKGGFDISEVGLGPVQKLIPGMAETEAMAMRREASRILQDAMDEPWEYVDEAGNVIPNDVSRHLDEFKDWVIANGDGTVTAQQLHEELRRFWNDISTGWEEIAKRSIRQELKPNEVYVTRRVSAEARKVYTDPKYTRAHEAGERLADEGAQAGKGKPKRDQSYATKERVFAPGEKFTWNRKGGPKRASFDIVEPGRPLQVGARQLAHAPSVRKQIEMFIREVDPDWAAKNTFFETDVAKLIDGYKSAQGRELIWAGMEDHLAAQGIFVEAADLDEVRAFFNGLAKAAKKGRTAQKNMGKAAGEKYASAQRAAARARGAMDTADVAAANRASAQADMWGLDPQIRRIQMSMMDLIDDVNAATVRSSRTGRFRTAPEAQTAMEDLLDMAVGLEVTGRMAKALREIQASLAGVDDLGFTPALDEAYAHITQQLAIARDTLEVAKNAAARLGGQDQTIRDLEALISGLEKGFVSEGTPNVIRRYVDDVHEVGRLAAELEAPITFNSGYRIPVSQADIANRPWAVTARNRLLRENEAEVQRLVREQKGTREQPGPARQLVAGERDALEEIADTFERGAERIPLLETEARRRTLLWVQGEFDRQTVDLSNRAQRHMGTYVNDPVKNNYNRFAAEAMDLDAQRNAMEANFHRMPDELGEIFETDMGVFQDADNMFGRLLDPTGTRPRGMTAGGEFDSVFETNIGALKAGLDDGALPFGPAYMKGTLGPELNPQLAELLRSRMNAGRGDIGGLLQAWDSVTGYFKAQAVARPAFIQRNGLGAFFNNMLAGMDMKNAVRFARLRGRAIEAGWKDALKEVGLTPDEVRNVKGSKQFMRTRPVALKRRAAELGAEKLAAKGDGSMRDLRRVYRSGAIGAGQAASEVAQSFRLHGATTLDRYGRPIRWNPLRRDNVWNTAIRNGNSEMEEFVRGSLALDSIVNGMSDADAIFRVNQFHFNYSKEGMTDWERNLGARAYPFYTWTRNSLPLMATQLLYNPKPFLRYLQLKNNIELGVEKDRTTPGWYGKRWGIDLSGLMGNPNQGARTWAFPDLPFMDLIEFAEMPLQDMERPFGGLTRLAEGFAPQIKFPVETMMGAQIFRNIPISTEYVKPPPLFDVPGLLPFLSKMPGDLVAKNSRGQYGIRENALYGLGTFVPLVSQMRRLFPREERYKDEDKLFSAWLSWVMPIGIRRQGPRDTRGARMQRQRERSMSRSERRSLERIR